MRDEVWRMSKNLLASSFLIPHPSFLTRKMRLRSTHILMVAIALLVLGLGVGGAVFVPSNKVTGPPQVTGMFGPSPSALQTASPSVLAGVAAALSATVVVASPIAPTGAVTLTSSTPALPGHNAPATPVIAAIPQTILAVPPTSALIKTQATPVQQPESTLAPPVKLLAPTGVPIPPIPKEERVGGPVTVPNNHDGPRWVSLQIGHYRNENFPEELQHLSTNTGASAAGVTEVRLNEEVTRKTASLLIERGYKVDILDATVPVAYVTDLFLAIHADGNDSSSLRGFKSTPPWNSVPASDEFVRILYEEYGKATGLPSDPVTSVGMADYYAFNPVTYRHAVSANVPGTLLEMGFVTNPEDRRVMTQEQDRVAWGIANAVDSYFRSGAAGNTPTPYPSFTPTVTPTGTPTHTSTPTQTSTSTPTETATPVPTEMVEWATASASLITPVTPTATATSPRPTKTPVPSPTPLRGIITSDGRWLPPLSPHVRGLPPPGSSAAPVLLTAEDDEKLMTAIGREQIQSWQQFYIPELGRSVWKKAYLRPIRH